MRRTGAALSLCMALAAAPVRALDYEGVWLEDHPRIANTSLQINGMGIRSKFFIRVYVAALYTAEKTGRAEAAIGSRQPRRLLLSMLRGMNSATIQESMFKGLKDNLTPAEMTALQPRLQQLQAIMRTVPEVDAGDIILFDFVPGEGATVYIRGKPRGTLAGDEISAALLKIWLGGHPVQPDLKDALLGRS